MPLFEVTYGKSFTKKVEAASQEEAYAKLKQCVDKAFKSPTFGARLSRGETDIPLPPDASQALHA